MKARRKHGRWTEKRRPIAVSVRLNGRRNCLRIKRRVGFGRRVICNGIRNGNRRNGQVDGGSHGLMCLCRACGRKGIISSGQHSVERIRKGRRKIQKHINDDMITRAMPRRVEYAYAYLPSNHCRVSPFPLPPPASFRKASLRLPKYERALYQGTPARMEVGQH